MRIAFVIEQLDPSRGGVERYACDLAAGLAARGHTVDVFVLRTPPADLQLPAGVRVETVPVAPGSRSTRHRRFDAALRRRLSDLSSWDVVQGFGKTTVHTVYRIGGGAHGAYLAAMAPSWPFWKRIWERLNPKNARLIRAEERIFSQPGGLYIANSQRSKDDVMAHFGVPEARIRVIHNGVDLARFRPVSGPAERAAARAHWRVPEAAFVGAFVGSGFARKGLAPALRILAELVRRGRDARLLVAGRGPRRYARLARRLGVGERVGWLGSVREVERVYAAADFFVLPSRYEAFGIAALEALACGLPVVVTKTCGVAEVLTSGREGILLEEPEAIGPACDFLERLAQDARLREEVGARARQAAEGLGVDRNVEQVLALYDEVRAGR